MTCDNCSEYSLSNHLYNTEPGLVCLSFNLFAFSSIQSEFKVAVENENEESTTAFRLGRLQMDRWKKYSVQLQITSERYARVKFESTYPVISLNRVMTTKGYCPNQHLCRFDGHTLCNWVDASRNPNFRFKLLSWMRLPSHGLVMKDAQQNLHVGRFLTVEQMVTVTQPVSAVLVSSEMDTHRRQIYCLEFQLFQLPDTVDVINVFGSTNYGGISNVIWTSEGLPSNKLFDWTPFQVEISNGSINRVVIQYVKKNNNFNNIGIDNLELTPGRCVKSINCDFRFDHCRFTLPQTFQGRSFISGASRLADPSALLPFDVNKLRQNAMNVYADFTIDSSITNEKRLGDFAVFSPWIRHSSQSLRQMVISLKFALHSVEAHSIRFRVQLEHQFGLYDLFWHSENTGRAWQYISLEADKHNYYRIRLIGERVQGRAAGWIAVGDFDIYEEVSAEMPPNEDNTKMERLSCDFSVDLCGWKNKVSPGFTLQSADDKTSGAYFNRLFTSHDITNLLFLLTLKSELHRNGSKWNESR
jgi:hypothetical protein